jgi:hypothetical protein
MRFASLTAMLPMSANGIDRRPVVGSVEHGPSVKAVAKREQASMKNA